MNRYPEGKGPTQKVVEQMEREGTRKEHFRCLEAVNTVPRTLPQLTLLRLATIVQASIKSSVADQFFFHPIRQPINKGPDTILVQIF
jgi:hypothetical protein